VDEKREKDTKVDESGRAAGKRAKAGNYQRDPAEQTCREDMDPELQEDCNEPARGSLPPRGKPPRLRLDKDDAVRGKGAPPLSQDPEHPDA